MIIVDKQEGPIEKHNCHRTLKMGLGIKNLYKIEISGLNDLERFNIRLKTLQNPYLFALYIYIYIYKYIYIY